jgi:hypothetical protein
MDMLYKIRTLVILLLIMGCGIPAPIYSVNNRTTSKNIWVIAITAIVSGAFGATCYLDYYNRLTPDQKPTHTQCIMYTMCAALSGALVGGLACSIPTIPHAPSLPTAPTPKKTPITTEGDCPICLESITQLKKNHIRLTRTGCCKNIFCHNCLEDALNSKQECPLCRNTHITVQTHSSIN